MKYGKNVELEITEKTLVVTIDLTAEMTESKSGKSKILATTSGNKSIDVPNRNLKFALNLYEPIKKE